MFKKFFGLLVILLILSVNISTPIASKYSKPSFKEVLADTLDTPITDYDFYGSDNPVIERIILFNPAGTVGEVLAVNMMLEEQLNNSRTGFNLSLYYDYLNNSSNYPIAGVDLTARELYEQAPGVNLLLIV
jgi:hypothetical protein